MGASDWENERGFTVVALQRIRPGVTPGHCVHGRATCVKCRNWVWLGDGTLAALQAGALPLCMECAEGVLDTPLPDGAEEPEFLGRIENH